MHRTFATPIALLAFVSLISIAADAFAAEPDRARANRPLWGTVTKATAESVTIMPETAVRRGAKPAAERAFALAKDETEFLFAEVGMRRRMADGSTLRTLNDPEPATAADLKEGQLVEVTPADDDAGAAKRIIIAWSVPGTIVKVTNDSITFRPAESAPAKKDADANKDAAAEERTLKIHKDATRVRIATARPPEPSPTGRGIVTSIDYKNGTIADLKPDQNVVVCIKGDAAAKITILVSSGTP